ncbi:MAG: ATP-binding protein [candidate division NC10 bacterium]|jgi:CheY-like chemotaxis protein/two-component sensor histidine kinase
MTLESVSLQATDRVRLDEALADAETLRRIASSVGHDFNNLLAVITGYSELMLRKLRPDDPLRRNVESIKKATEWGVALAHQILAVSRKQGTASTPVSLNEAVTNVTRVLQPALGERIELVARLDPAAGRVAINQGQLGQVIMNLVVNARDAMPEGGRLTVETAGAGAEVVLSVSDTGVGMDVETRTRLFEPYFTTKEPGKGMGLGLATVFDVVTQNGGRIDVGSEPGRGSTFRIFLPRMEDEVEAATGSAPAAAAAPGVDARTVLVVEDEGEVRDLIREILKFDRHVVLEARDREEALALSERHEGPIDLLIADVVLPGAVTEDLVRRVTAARPGIRVLYVSGYLDDAGELEGFPRLGPIVQKPFTVAAFTQAVREALNGGG